MLQPSTAVSSRERGGGEGNEEEEEDDDRESQNKGHTQEREEDIGLWIIYITWRQRNKDLDKKLISLKPDEVQITLFIPTKRKKKLF